MKQTIINKLFPLLSFVVIINCASREASEESPKLTWFTLTIEAGKGGTLSPDANGVYKKGATVTFRATPNEGYVFDRWEGTDSKDCGWVLPPDCRGGVTMYSDRDVKVFLEE